MLKLIKFTFSLFFISGNKFDFIIFLLIFIKVVCSVIPASFFILFSFAIAASFCFSASFLAAIFARRFSSIILSFSALSFFICSGVLVSKSIDEYSTIIDFCLPIFLLYFFLWFFICYEIVEYFFSYYRVESTYISKVFFSKACWKWTSFIPIIFKVKCIFTKF